MLKLKQYIQFSAFNSYKKVILTKNLQIVAKILRFAFRLRKNKTRAVSDLRGFKQIKS